MEESQTPNTETGQTFLSVVVPVFREGVQLSAFLASVRDFLCQCNLPYELVLVDDGSPDETWRVIAGEAKSCQAIRALRLSRNFGKESALCAGLEHARGDAVIVMDADGQHPPSLLPDIVRMWQNSGADIVEAVKRKRGSESLSSKLGALLFYFILNKLSGFHFKGASDFKLMNRKALDAWLRMHERNVFFRGMTVWMGFTTVQIPFEVVPRSTGQSTWSVFKRLPAAFGHLCRRDFPCRVSSFRDRDGVPEADRSSGKRVRYGDSIGTNHRKFPHDQSWYHRRVPGPDL